MQSLAYGEWTAEEVADRLHAAHRTVAFRYELLDSDNVHTDWLDGVIAGSIENNALASIKRTAKLTIRDLDQVDWLSSRVRPWYRLKMSAGSWAEWPLGIFLLSSPRKQVRTGGDIREVEAYDQLLILADDKVEDRYVIDSGVNYVTAIGTLLTSAGIDAQNLVATDKTLPSARDWEPGTSKLSIVNDLLGSINYRSLYFNSFGAAVAEPYVAPDGRPTGYAYAADSRSLIEPDVDVDFDLFGIPNKWVLVVSEPDRPVLTASYTNSEASSPTSTVSRGRTIVDFRKVDAADQAALDDKAARLAFESSQVYEIVELRTATMPHHEDNEVIRLTYGAADLSARYTEHTWSMELKAGASMSHRLRRVVTV